IVVRMIVRPQPGSAVVGSAGRQCGYMESIDCGAVLGRDRHMDDAVEAAFAADPQVRLAADAEARRLLIVLRLSHFHHHPLAHLPAPPHTRAAPAPSHRTPSPARSPKPKTRDGRSSIPPWL